MSNWSKNPPTEPGWYWYQHGGLDAVVVKADIGMGNFLAYGHWWDFDGKGEWFSEPIEPPHE